MTTDADPETLIPVTELARQVRVHRTTIYRYIRLGLLPAHRIGIGKGTLRVAEKDWDAYLAACREAATP
jgi:excisionase family DNA binding protein